MPTIRQVAALANVSPATASRVLGKPRNRLRVSPETAQRVREAADRLGYRLNYHMQAVSTGRANVTGFAQEVLLDPEVGSGSGNLYFDTLRRGVEFTAQEAGMALMSIHPGRGLTALQRGAQYLQERRLDVLVVPESGAVQESAAMFAADPNLPLVLVNSTSSIRRPQVRFDMQAAMRLIVEHLRSLGHREVLWFGPHADLGGDRPERQRMFVEAAWDAGLRGATFPVGEELVSSRSTVDGFIAGARKAMREKIAEPGRDWTGIVAYNDHWAVGACAALRDAGLRVPDDISVVGFDNLGASSCIPGLTAIDHRFYEMGRRAGILAARLVEAAQDEKSEMQDYIETVSPELVVRESTGPAPA